MRRNFSILFALLALFLVPFLAFAEKIDGFSSRIKIHQDGTFTVAETIMYDFGGQYRHGIYRDIPYKYQARGGNFSVRISDISVTDENGSPDQFSVSNNGDDKRIKIGDPNATITGVRTYVIRYTVSRAINYFSDHDELYWNVTGSSWQTPIYNVTARVTVEGYDGTVQKECFAGAFGTNTPCALSPSSTGEAFFAQEELEPYAGMTIVAGWPKGVVAKPGFWQNFLLVLKDNWGLGLPVIVFVLMFWLWMKKGRDPLNIKTVVAQYEPLKDLTPTEVGTLVDESAGNADVSSEIIYLAVRGYLKITRLDKKILGVFSSTDYRLDKLKDQKDLPNEFERIFMDGLFPLGDSTELSSLKNTFYTTLKGVKDRVYRLLVNKGYFARNPQTVRAGYITLSVLAFIGSFVVGIFTQNIFSGIGMAVSAVIVGIFGNFMPRATVKGAEGKNYVKGLKLYLSVAEKDRLKFHNAPEKSPERFEKLLPYAMALGVEKEWAKQFEGIYKTPPSWYSDPGMRTFHALYLTSALHDFNRTANATMVSQPRSSGASGGSGFGGGGFSGGGFGGGGGGSW